MVALSGSGEPISTSRSALSWVWDARSIDSWLCRSMAPAAVQTKHSVATKTTSAPAAFAQAAMAGPEIPSRSPMAITFFPWSMCLLFTPSALPLRGTVSLEKDAHPVGQLGHAPEEQAALGEEQDPIGVPGGEAVEGVGEVAERRRQVPLGGGEAGHAPPGDEVGDLGPLDVLAGGGEGGDDPVVAGRHVARALGLGDLGVVELGGVIVDLGHADAVASERLDGQGLHDLGL